MTHTILIATHNPAKLGELRQTFSTLLPEDVQLTSLTDVGITEDVEETGHTFEENAKLKALYYAKKSQLPTIADDGGICIDALNGAPGIHSKRWLGREASDAELIHYCLEQMRGVPETKRTAHFEVVLAFCPPDVDSPADIQTARGTVDGHMTTTRHENTPPGFPYRALFVVDKYGLYYDELSPLQHEHINHRVHAAQSLAPAILAWYNKDA
jgi:XTP/dITP diphosphohydrolase